MTVSALRKKAVLLALPEIRILRMPAACAMASSIPITRGEERRSLAAEAVQTLQRAVAAGWNDAGKTSRDPDMAPLRDREDFRRLLAELFDHGFPADPFAR